MKRPTRGIWVGLGETAAKARYLAERADGLDLVLARIDEFLGEGAATLQASQFLSYARVCVLMLVRAWLAAAKQAEDTARLRPRP